MVGNEEKQFVRRNEEMRSVLARELIIKKEEDISLEEVDAKEEPNNIHSELLIKFEEGKSIDSNSILFLLFIPCSYSVTLYSVQRTQHNE